jgi:hypothetical protein
MKKMTIVFFHRVGYFTYLTNLGTSLRIIVEVNLEVDILTVDLWLVYEVIHIISAFLVVVSTERSRRSFPRILLPTIAFVKIFRDCLFEIQPWHCRAMFCRAMLSAWSLVILPAAVHSTPSERLEVILQFFELSGEPIRLHLETAFEIRTQSIESSMVIPTFSTTARSTPSRRHSSFTTIDAIFQSFQALNKLIRHRLQPLYSGAASFVYFLLVRSAML